MLASESASPIFNQLSHKIAPFSRYNSKRDHILSLRSNSGHPVHRPLSASPHFTTVPRKMADPSSFSVGMDDSDENQPRLGLVISSSASESNFPPPPGWSVSTQVIEPITFEIHTSRRQDAGPSVITFSDIGLSETYFAPFFQYCRRENVCPQLDVAAAHYHTCFPGHFTDSPTLSSSEDTSLDAVVLAISKLIENYEIKRVLGIGVGLGATMLLRANAKHPKIFCGLVLVSPIIAPSTIPERIVQAADDVLNSSFSLGLTRRIKDRFIARWVSDSTREQLCSAVQVLDDDLDRRNPSNVMRMTSQDAWRKDSSPCIADVSSRVMLITGRESALRFHVNDAIHLFDSKQSTWLDVEGAGSLVQDEVPDRVGKALSLFLQTIPGFT